MQDCTYKMYAVLWISNITSWVFKTGFASAWQKGFMPVNGYYEHLFLAQNILHSTYKGKESLYVMYYGF